MKIASIEHHSVVDGPGVRTAVFFQGCLHRCRGCHSRALWDEAGGQEMTVSQILAAIGAGLLQGDEGVTLTGGDPLAQQKLEEAARVCVALHSAGVHTIVYTGYLYEDILQMAEAIPALKTILYSADVLVDGPFVLARRNERLPFRGSDNQRVIDLAATRRMGEVVLLDWTGVERVSIVPDGDVIFNLHPDTLPLAQALGDILPVRNCGEGGVRWSER